MHDTASANVNQLLALLDTGNDWAAMHLGLDVLADVGPTRLVTELLRPVQQEVGWRWERGEYAVAHEHVATELVRALLGSAIVAAGAPDPERRELVLVCAEGEWHTVAARMADVLARAAGWPVRFVGASLPADELARTLSPETTRAVCISCTVPGALGGVRAISDVAHEAGLPVVAGGAAMDGTELQRTLCVDVIDTDITSALTRLDGGGPQSASTHAPVPADVELERTYLQAIRPHVLVSVAERSGTDVEEAGRMLDVLDASLLTEDEALLGRHVRWWRSRADAARPTPDEIGQVLELTAELIDETFAGTLARLDDAHRELARI